MATKKKVVPEEEEEQVGLDPVEEAAAALQLQKQNQPQAYQSRNQQQLDQLSGQLLNRKAFSYDPNADILYRQAVDQYVRQGKMAMLDTMGRAQTMTGGYGNTYARNAGQQAYQGYLQQAADRLPEYYQLARDAYDRQGQDMASRLALVQSREDSDYGRYQDALASYYGELDRLQGRFDQERQFQYQTQRDDIADRQWQAELAEEVRQFNHKHGIRDVDASAEAAQKEAEQAQWWDWWFNRGGKDGFTDDRKGEIVQWVADSLNNVHSPSFSLDRLISNTGFLTTDREREYAQAVGKYIAGIS